MIREQQLYPTVVSWFASGLSYPLQQDQAVMDGTASLAKVCRSIHDTRQHCTHVTTAAGFALWRDRRHPRNFPHYSATTNGIRGTAEHLVRLTDHNYRLNVSLEAKLGGLEIGELEQASEFSYADGQIKPLTYSYQVSGVSSAVETVVFNWDAMMALSADDEESRPLAINSNTLDELSCNSLWRSTSRTRVKPLTPMKP